MPTNQKKSSLPPINLAKKIGVLALVLTPIGLLALDAFFYPGFTQRHLGIEPLFLLLFFLAGQLIFRIGWRKYLLPFFTPRRYYSWLWLTGGWLASWVILRLLNQFYFPNFSFATVHLQAAAMDWVAVYLALTTIIQLSRQKIQKFHPWLTFLLPFLGLSICYFLWDHWAHEIFAKLKKEDGLFEYGTFLAFLLAGIYSAQGAVNLINCQLKNWWLKIITGLLVIASLGLVFVAGEEISWGQRIFGIETPPEIAAQNTQGEITIHNNKKIIGYVYYGYLAIAIYAATAGIGLKILSRLGGQKLVQKLKWLVPSWYLMGYFLPIIIYVPLRETYGYIVFGDWEEMSELFLSLGILGHFGEVKKMSRKVGKQSK